jgi:GNAT superfamily N-acetyltransferase
MNHFESPPALQIEIISTDNISAELNQQIDEIDHLAFADEKHDDPEFNSIDWSSHIEYMALGRVDGELATLLGLLKREILVGEKHIWLAGVGGVATHPNWQKRGLSSALLQAAEKFMREEMKVPFGLLVCANERRTFYGRAGWKQIADEMFFIQDKQRRSLKTSVMILPLIDQGWPSGEIDLRGLPW